MSNPSPLDSLAKAISEPMEKLYKEGNLTLVFVFVGTLFLLVAVFLQNSVSYLVGIFGFLIVTINLYLFYIKQIKPYKELKGRKEINDIFKDSSVTMVKIACNLHNLTIANATKIEYFTKQYQEVVLPILELAARFNLPQAKNAIDNNKYAIQTRNATSTILKFTHDTENTIKDVRVALIESDTKRLRQYYNQLQAIDQRLQDLLSTVDSTN